MITIDMFIKLPLKVDLLWFTSLFFRLFSQPLLFRITAFDLDLAKLIVNKTDLLFLFTRIILIAIVVAIYLMVTFFVSTIIRISIKQLRISASFMANYFNMLFVGLDLDLIQYIFQWIIIGKSIRSLRNLLIIILLLLIRLAFPNPSINILFRVHYLLNTIDLAYTFGQSSLLLVLFSPTKQSLHYHPFNPVQSGFIFDHHLIIFNSHQPHSIYLLYLTQLYFPHSQQYVWKIDLVII